MTGRIKLYKIIKWKNILAVTVVSNSDAAQSGRAVQVMKCLFSL